MSQSSNKRLGRFIKGDDPIRKVLTINDFNLMDICEKPFTYHDNASANVIHQRLHTEADLSDGVRASYEIDSSFPHEGRPVIRPLDFTDEWRRQKKRMANRQHRLDDEDELDLENRRAENAIDLAIAKYSEIEPDAIMVDPFFYFLPESRPQRLAAQPEAARPEPTVRPQANSAPAAPRASGQASAPTVPSRNLDTEIFKGSHHEGPLSAQVPGNHQSSGFIPTPPQHEVQKILEAAPPSPPPISEEELEEIREEAAARGYQQGFQLGEEKGTLQAQQSIVQIVEQLSAVLDNLNGMQAAILQQAQENFATICQSLIEAVLQREFRLNPENFGTIIERALNEALPEDSYRIHVSPKAYKSLAQWSNAALRERLKPDESLDEFAFRVEGEHAVVDAKLSNIIKNLLEKTDLRLFEEGPSERAS